VNAEEFQNRFAWDKGKEKSNVSKHGISFNEAATVFEDEYALYGYDEKHSENEERFIVIGVSKDTRLLMVCHCYRNGDKVVRIISARKANIKEQAQYRKGQ